MPRNRFVHLHVHSEYSLLDGLSQVDDIVSKAKTDNQEAIAITDHGRMSGTPEFFQACRKYDVRPIIGEEFYITADATDRSRHVNTETGKKEGPQLYHMVMLARDRHGYELLCALSSQSNDQENYYYKPRIDYKMLESLSKKDRSSIVVSNTCLSSNVNRLILSGNLKEARRLMLYLRELFPYYYLEIQRHDINEHDIQDMEYSTAQETVNVQLLKWSQKYEIPIIITNDSHYTNAEDHPTHDLWLACQTGANVHATDRFRFNGYGYHVKTAAEMRQLWDDETWKKSQQSISFITSGIDIQIPEFEQKKWHVPVAPRKSHLELTSMEYIRRKCLTKLRELRDNNGLAAPVSVYKARLEYEAKIIQEANFEEEFLIVLDYIAWARRNKIRVGPGRGSMAGVLHCFLLGIVDVDAIRYSLMFERAINPARPSLPDFDIDFAKSRREDVVRYLLERYNRDGYEAKQVGTFARSGPRGTIQSVMRALGVNKNDYFSASKSLPDAAEISNLKSSGELEDIFELPNLHPVITQAMEDYPEFKNWCIDIQGLVTGEGKHAAGVVISDDKFGLHKLVPTMMVGRGAGRGNAAVVTQYDMDGLKKLGVVKFDILSLLTLDIIQETIDLIGHDPFDGMYDYEDEKVFKMLNKGACGGIFQIEGNLSRQVVRELQLKSFEDVIATMALGRTGAYQFLPQYREGRDNPGTVHAYLDERLKRIMPNGVILYQEQVMEIGLQIGGFDHHLVDELKEAIKYKKGDVWDKLKPLYFYGGDFIDEKSGKSKGTSVGALNNGLDEETATKIWDMIFAYRGYGFNRAHATSYAMISYQTAYLKRYWPAQFYSVLLSHCDKENRHVYIEEAKRYFKINFLAPDINTSRDGFTVIDRHTIRYGLSSILGVGPSACQELVAKQPFESVEDLLARVEKRKCNSRVIATLQRIGALESLGRDGEIPRDRVEYELLGDYVTSHPLDQFKSSIDERVREKRNYQYLANAVATQFWVGGMITKVKYHTTKKGDPMAFCTVTYNGFGEWDIVVFPQQFERYKASIRVNKPVCIYGTYQPDKNSILMDQLIVMTKTEMYKAGHP